VKKTPRLEDRYFTVIGNSWAGVRRSHRRSATEPFVGVRFEKNEGWVVFEPRNPAFPVDRATVGEIERTFEAVDSEAWCDEHVFICQVRSIAHGHAVVRRVMGILQRNATAGPGSATPKSSRS
jgi:hypothetical protein